MHEITLTFASFPPPPTSAEKALASALDGFGHKWKLNPGDGAFYGPKIDIRVNDALNRMHQVGRVREMGKIEVGAHPRSAFP